jgi:hypothetical protein
MVSSLDSGALLSSLGDTDSTSTRSWKLHFCAKVWHLRHVCGCGPGKHLVFCFLHVSHATDARAAFCTGALNFAFELVGDNSLLFACPPMIYRCVAGTGYAYHQPPYTTTWSFFESVTPSKTVCFWSPTNFNWQNSLSTEPRKIFLFLAQLLPAMNIRAPNGRPRQNCLKWTVGNGWDPNPYNLSAVALLTDTESRGSLVLLVVSCSNKVVGYGFLELNIVPLNFMRIRPGPVLIIVNLYKTVVHWGQTDWH